MNLNDIIYRESVRFEDINRVAEIVRSTHYFREDEIIIARELIEEAFNKGKGSGYEFLFAENDGITSAYSCYGLIPCSLVSFDLYWIVTHNDFRGMGIGRRLLEKTEENIWSRGGKTIYVETSSKDQYISTRIFYEKNNYILKARFEDFYDVGDDKCIYIKNTPKQL
jgi:GNAT superfamily N-acetyltransferase